MTARPWTGEELIRLKKMLRQQANVADIANSLGRRAGSVKAQVRDMGLVPLKKPRPKAIRRLVELGLKAKNEAMDRRGYAEPKESG